MKYLLDTCVLSELVKPSPDPNVVAWVEGQNEEDLCLSVLTFGELHKGVARLASSRRKEGLHQWLEHDLRERFGSRILAVTLTVAQVWGEVQCRSEQQGRPLPAFDGLIAATGLTHGLTVVTRNGSDMEPSGVELLDPWEESGGCVG